MHLVATSISTRFSLSMEMSRLTQDGTADKMFPVQLTTRRIDNLTWLILLLLYVMTIRDSIRLKFTGEHLQQ